MGVIMTHKEFYYWLEGYLHEKKISSYDEAVTFLLVIKEKMNEVKEVSPFFPNSRTTIPIQIPVPNNPFKDDGYDDLGAPPKIVM
jgi:hypothetical protein